MSESLTVVKLKEPPENVSFLTGIQWLLESQADILASLPKDSVLLRRTDLPAGSMCVHLANGLRLILQYQIQTDTFAAHIDAVVVS